jgi:hypothetical protein
MSPSFEDRLKSIARDQQARAGLRRDSENAADRDGRNPADAGHLVVWAEQLRHLDDVIGRANALMRDSGLVLKGSEQHAGGKQIARYQVDFVIQDHRPRALDLSLFKDGRVRSILNGIPQTEFDVSEGSLALYETLIGDVVEGVMRNV